MIRCCEAGRVVKAFAARYRLHRADPALSCVVIFDRAVAVDCVHADAAVPEYHVLWKKRACG